MNEVTKRCLNCNQPMQTTRGWKAYCNPRCQREYYWRTHKIVETPLQPRKSRKEVNNDFDIA